MNEVSSLRNTQTCWILAFALIALFVGPSLIAAEDASDDLVPASNAARDAVLAPADSAGAPLSLEDAGLPKPVFKTVTCIEICGCQSAVTPPTTRVGATCLRARQNAAAAARTFAVCPSNSNGKCANTTHSVAPCQALPTGGFSATAVATYWCEFCEEDCIDTCL